MPLLYWLVSVIYATDLFGKATDMCMPKPEDLLNLLDIFRLRVIASKMIDRVDVLRDFFAVL